jgi:nucleoside-diphosphate-sugar epimerase
MLPRSLALPRWLMMGLALGLKRASTLLRPLVSFTPTLTPFAVNFVCLDFTFRGHKAARELGYQPAYSEQEAFERTIAYFRKS